MNSQLQSATYHGHRQQSYLAIDTGEQVELRARQRTFDNAYLRTCLVNLSYSAVILKLFDSRFYNSKYSIPLWGDQHLRSDILLSPVGLLYAILAALLLVTAYIRGRHSNRDFSDQARAALESRNPLPATARVWGRPFTTAGWTVVQVTVIVASVQIILLVLLLRL